MVLVFLVVLVLVFLLLLGVVAGYGISRSKAPVYPLILSFLFLSCGAAILFAATTNSWRTGTPRC